MSILYLDLDGTLVDVRRRHYRAYADTTEELGLVTLPEQEYWEARRNGASNADLIGDVDPAVHEAFALKFLERVEAPSYVRLDTLIPGARATLAALRESYELVLVTLRQNRESLLEQLDELALSKFFRAVYSRTSGDEPPSKTRLIRLSDEMVEDDAKVVGDSEADIETARELGIDSICVSNGVRSRRYLDELHPDELVQDIRQLPRALGNKN
jgi:phosphoglycolate phosphatase